MPTLTLVQAEGLVVRTLTRCRTSIDNARSVARALIAAEADGLKGHGLSRVPMYAAQAKVRKIDGTFKPLATHPRPGLIAIDAGYGFAFPAIELAEAELLAAARAQGIAAAAIRKSSHCGAAGHPVERLAENGPGRADVRQHAGRDGAVGRLEGAVRHQPGRLRLSAARPRRRW